MKKNKLREHLNSGKPLLSTRMWSTNPLFWEIVGQTGNFDYVEFLAEYAPFDFTDLPNMARAAELNDMGTMLIGEQAVECGLIDKVGGIKEALAKLNELIKEKEEEK